MVEENIAPPITADDIMRYNRDERERESLNRVAT
jgi:hypothetical protein